MIHELCRDDLAVAQLHAVAPQLFVDDGELVAFADVLNEVDVPLENAGHVHRAFDRRCRRPCRLRTASFESRRGRPSCGCRLSRSRSFAAKPDSSPGDRQQLDVVELAAQREHLAVSCERSRVGRPASADSALRSTSGSATIAARSVRLKPLRRNRTSSVSPRFTSKSEGDSGRLRRARRIGVATRSRGRREHRAQSAAARPQRRRRSSRLAHPPCCDQAASSGSRARAKRDQPRSIQRGADAGEAIVAKAEPLHVTRTAPSGSAWEKLRSCLYSRGGSPLLPLRFKPAQFRDGDVQRRLAVLGPRLQGRVNLIEAGESVLHG